MFNLAEIIDEYKPDVKELAPVLYPGNQYPNLALNRAIKGEALLNTDQVEALASFLGVLPYELFSLNGWASKPSGDSVVFTKAGHKVRLHRNGCLISVRKENGFSEQYVAIQKALTLHEFIEYIDNLIFPKKDGTNQNLN